MQKHLTADSQTGDTAERGRRFKEVAVHYVRDAIHQIYRSRPSVIPVLVIQNHLDKHSGFKFEGRTIGNALKELDYERHETRLATIGEDRTQTPIYISKDKSDLLGKPMTEVRDYLLTPESVKTLRNLTLEFYEEHFQPKRSTPDE